MIFGLLGEKLHHSYSPQIHRYLGAYEYPLYEIAADALNDFFKDTPFNGINVTIPYKKAVIPFCAELSPRAKKLGAVNTIVRRDDGTFIGHNTDYFGFTYMVQQSGLTVSGKKALVLGSGGASVTAVAVLQEMGAEVIVVSRSGPNNYSNITLHSDAALIVNATPVGMYPNVGCSPVDISLFPKLEGVLDMIYNPARTKLLLDAEARGIVAENGLWMLVAQAKESAEWFLNKSISNDVIPMIYRQLQNQMVNIALIGMPGSGKSTIGKSLAEQLNRRFVDADALIEELAGKSIPTIFEEDGETIFRQWETKALEAIGKESSLVIATGGGCVTQSRNFPLLHQNSTIIWIQRELASLATDGRPLSASGKLESMYHNRKAQYDHFADMAVENNAILLDTVKQILKMLYTEDVQ